MKRANFVTLTARAVGHPQRLFRCVGTSTTAGNTVTLDKALSGESGSDGDIRDSVATWIKIGQYKKGLLSHLSNKDVVRALFVLKMCSIEKLVDNSSELFELAVKLGPLAKWPLRKTFFDQFVGGEELNGMAKVVSSMQQRGLTLMVAPVLEEDPDDQKSSKKTYDNNISNLLELADMCASLEKKKPILQLKMSAIVPPNTLEEVTDAINAGGLDAESLAKTAEEFADAMDNPDSLSLGLTKENRGHFIEGLRRADKLAKRAQELSILITVDAEFFSCQRAISTVALALMAKYNSKERLVGNTIQGYLKEAVENTKVELDVVQKFLKVNWYGKVVRGAYMDRERKYAKDRGVSSPICDSYEATNRSYNNSVALILNHIAEVNPGSGLLVATHNENSIRLAAQRMKNYSIPETNGPVAFGQIYGMADYLSAPLVEQKYTVYKSTPYGPMVKVMPYLSRRASENRSVIQGAREERNMLVKELRHRLRIL